MAFDNTRRDANSPNARPLRRLIGAPMAAIMFAGVLVGSLADRGSAAPKHSGNVDVLYAASLQDIMENSIGPAFERATGYSFTGFSGASGTLANEVKGGVQRGDVFVSASQSVNASLEGPANGNWVDWFVTFANSPLLIGFNTSGPFAAQLRKGPWWEAITQPGIRLGRTDPTTDPKGKLTVQALTAAAAIYNDPALTSITATTANVYPEQTLVGLLQSGQLDAAFFYASEAKAAGIPTVKLGRISLSATYTVTILNNAPDAASALAFTEFLLGTKGSSLLRKEGAVVVRPRLSGSPSALPRSLRLLLAVR